MTRLTNAPTDSAREQFQCEQKKKKKGRTEPLEPRLRLVLLSSSSFVMGVPPDDSTISGSSLASASADLSAVSATESSVTGAGGSCWSSASIFLPSGMQSDVCPHGIIASMVVHSFPPLQATARSAKLPFLARCSHVSHKERIRPRCQYFLTRGQVCFRVRLHFGPFLCWQFRFICCADALLQTVPSRIRCGGHQGLQLLPP